jgi:hypothetical protein
MAEYKSRFSRFTFWAKSEAKRFQNGRYVTEDPDEIAVLDGMVDTERVDAPAKPAAKSKPEK